MDTLGKDIQQALAEYPPPSRLRRVGKSHLSVVVNNTFERPDEQMPRALEKKYGLTGISAVYRMPAMPDDILDYVAAVARMPDKEDSKCGRLSELAAGLVGRNPELKDIKYDEGARTSLAAFIGGVAGGLVPHDIARRVEQSGARPEKKDSWYDKIHQGVERDVGMLGWSPALDTLTSMHTQLSRLKKADAPLPERSGIVVNGADSHDDVPLFI